MHKKSTAPTGTQAVWMFWIMVSYFGVIGGWGIAAENGETPDIAPKRSETGIAGNPTMMSVPTAPFPIPYDPAQQNTQATPVVVHQIPESFTVIWTRDDSSRTAAVGQAVPEIFYVAVDDIPDADTGVRYAKIKFNVEIPPWPKNEYAVVCSPPVVKMEDGQAILHPSYFAGSCQPKDENGNLLMFALETEYRIPGGRHNFQLVHKGNTLPGRAVRVDVIDLILKASSAESPTGSLSKYNDSPSDENASNLFAVWPGEIFILTAATRGIPKEDRPANFIRWKGNDPFLWRHADSAAIIWQKYGVQKITVSIPAVSLTHDVHVDVPDVGTTTEDAYFLMIVANTFVNAFEGGGRKHVKLRDLAKKWAEVPTNSSRKQDAYRHAYWNALMVSSGIPNFFATGLATAHEYDNKHEGKNMAFNTTMDLFNNKVGRDIKLNDEEPTVILVFTSSGFTLKPGIRYLPKYDEIKKEIIKKFNDGEIMVWEDDKKTDWDSTGILVKSNDEKYY